MVQCCALSGTPFKSVIETDFECLLVQTGEDDADAPLADDMDDDVEEVPSSGIVDLGEIASQYLALKIDYYAMAPNVSSEFQPTPDPQE